MGRPFAVYIEAGAKKVFAAALEWPGLARSAKSEAEALQALVEYAPRYQKILADAHRIMGGAGEFSLADLPDLQDLQVVERLAGSSTTDFGAPGAVPAADTLPLAAGELERLGGLLDACWDGLLERAHSAQGGTLRTGPRGGGRQLDGIVAHVVEAHLAYLRQLGADGKQSPQASPAEQIVWVKATTRQALQAAADGVFPAVGPRGGLRWTARYFARRSAWHILDHVWEIEDRVE